MEKLVSNEQIEEKAISLVNAIKENDQYKEYIELKEKIEKDKTITKKIKEIKNLQKQYVKSAYLDKKIEKQLEEIKKELAKNLLYKNYLDKEKQINNILTTINEGLNIMFNNILNKNEK